MALSYLWSIDPDNVESSGSGDFLEKWPAQDRKIILQNASTPVEFPRDLFLRPIVRRRGRPLRNTRQRWIYEGQAAIELEQSIEPDSGSYEGCITRGSGPFVIDTFPMIEAVVEDVRRGVPAGIISARFHNGIIRLLCEAGSEAARSVGLARIALSGGVFQNAYLSERLERGFSGWASRFSDISRSRPTTPVSLWVRRISVQKGSAAEKFEKTCLIGFPQLDFTGYRAKAPGIKEPFR